MQWKEERIKEYLLPVRVAAASDNVENAESLLTGFEKQNFFKISNYCAVKGKGYVILDFGREIYGTARIMMNEYKNQADGVQCNLRLRFGESLSETCCEVGEKGETNDHSTRDIRCYMSSNSDMEWGNTGFRFLRIDFLAEQEYRINKIAAGFIHTDVEKIGEFKSGGRLQKIYDTAAYTLFLNMQNLIWDGVKRDQHLWVGDLYPEMLGILYAYGNVKIVKESLVAITEHYTLPAWYNGIPAYNVWFTLCVNDYLKLTGDTDERLTAAVKGNLEQFEKCVSEEGQIDFGSFLHTDWGEYFFEWPCEGTPYAKTGVFYLLKYAMKKIAEEDLFDEEIAALAKEIYRRTENNKQGDVPVKSIEALRVLCGENVAEGVKYLKKGGAKGCSIFFSYFILKALAENGEADAAVKIAKEYYGAMLEKGATTFWENFNVEWCENSCRIDEFPAEGQKDIHGDFGAHCYTGFRHSLCHGWSSGVIAFLAENVAGVKVTGKGFSKVRIVPAEAENVRDFSCTVPTPYGNLAVSKVTTEGKSRYKCVIPKGIEVV